MTNEHSHPPNMQVESQQSSDGLPDFIEVAMNKVHWHLDKSLFVLDRGTRGSGTVLWILNSNDPAIRDIPLDCMLYRVANTSDEEENTDFFETGNVPVEPPMPQESENLSAEERLLVANGPHTKWSSHTILLSRLMHKKLWLPSNVQNPSLVQFTGTVRFNNWRKRQYFQNEIINAITYEPAIAFYEVTLYMLTVKPLPRNLTHYDHVVGWQHSNCIPPCFCGSASWHFVKISDIIEILAPKLQDNLDLINQVLNNFMYDPRLIGLKLCFSVNEDHLAFGPWSSDSKRCIRIFAKDQTYMRLMLKKDHPSYNGGWAKVSYDHDAKSWTYKNVLLRASHTEGESYTFNGYGNT